jgi:hypothetical protein
VVARQVERHADRGLVAHERTVALVGLDDQRARSRPRVAPQPFGLEQRQLAAGDDRRVLARAAQRLERHRDDGRLAAGAAHRDRARFGDPVREHLRAMDERQAAPLRDREVGHLLLDRGGHHDRGTVAVGAAAVLRVDRDAEPFELRARLGALAAVEAAVAAARAAAAHRLELRERAHAAAADARVMEARGRTRIRHRAGTGRDDHERIAFAHAVEQFDDVGVRQAHAAVRRGHAEFAFAVRAVHVHVALERVAARAAVDAVLESFEREDAREDQVVVARLVVPHLARGLAAHEHRAARRAVADAAVHAMPARRRAERARLAADSIRGRGHRPPRERFAAREQPEALRGDVHEHPARGRLAVRRAGARERGGDERSERLGVGGIGERGHARQSATAVRRRPRGARGALPQPKRGPVRRPAPVRFGAARAS